MKEFINNGFTFGHIDIEDQLVKDVLAIEFACKANNFGGKDSIGSDHPVYKTVVSKLIKVLEPAFVDLLIQTTSVKLHIVDHNECIPIHHDLSEDCLGELLVWICESNNYKGREFMYGTYQDGLKLHKPKTGDFVIINDHNPKFIHAVNGLSTNTRIIGLTFKLMPFSK